VTPDKLAAIEDRLRGAYADAAATIAPADIGSAQRARQAGPRGNPPFRPPIVRMAVPAAAAAAVLLIIVTALAAPRLVHGHPGRAAAAVPPAGAPGYLLTFLGAGYQHLAIRNAQTAQVIGQTPRPSNTGYWYSIAAESKDTFIAGWDQDSYSCPGDVTYLYQITLTGHGTVASFRRIGRPISGDIMGASVSGDSIGYVLLSDLKGCGLSGTPGAWVVIRNLNSGTITAWWSVPATWSVWSISVADGGKAIAVGAYKWSGTEQHQLLTQSTFDLRSGTSGTSLVSHAAVDGQAWPSVLSAGNKMLYAILLKSASNPRAYADPKPVTFELVAASTANGRVTRVFHTWRAVWGDFNPALTIDPSGEFLLIVDGASMARVDLASGQYVPLTATARIAFFGAGRFPNGQVGELDPLAY
jgi:hypothetical protein